MSGVAIGGSGRLMSSTAMVTRMPGRELRVERLRVQRVVQRVADRGARVGQPSIGGFG